jgi:hypothetical protein
MKDVCWGVRKIYDDGSYLVLRLNVGDCCGQVVLASCMGKQVLHTGFYVTQHVMSTSKVLMHCALCLIYVRNTSEIMNPFTCLLGFTVWGISSSKSPYVHGTSQHRAGSFGKN